MKGLARGIGKGFAASSRRRTREQCGGSLAVNQIQRRLVATHPSASALSAMAQPATDLNHFGFLTAAAGKGNPEKMSKNPLGEDAYFIGEDENAFGVADGVSQWSDIDIDPGMYSRQLMQSCHDEVIKMGQRQDFIDPKEVLERAYKHTLSTIGSSTACLVSLDSDGTLRAANLGDSGFMVFRCGMQREPPYSNILHQKEDKVTPAATAQWNLMYRSNDMQKFFNCPDQLGPGCPDRPSRAETYLLPVKPGDLVIVATDGLLDNFSETEICVLLKKLSLEVKEVFPDNNFEIASYKLDQTGQVSSWLNNVAKNLVDEAHAIGMSTTARTPFRKQCHRAGFKFEGGKLDDTVVVLGMVMGKDESRP